MKMTSNGQAGSFDSGSEATKNEDDSFSGNDRVTELLGSANRKGDPFPLESSIAGSPRTPGSLLPSWASPSYLLSALSTSRKRHRSLHSVSAGKTAIAAGSSENSIEKSLEPTWIAEALLELDSIVRNGTNTPVQTRQVWCRCTKSKCLKLYCSCYSSGMSCTPFCSCVGCENTSGSGIENHHPSCNCVGCKSVKIETTLKVVQGVPSEESQSCSCKNSRCLRLYCKCFQSGSFCNSSCRCVECLNTPTENAARESAIKDCLRRRADAFDARPKVTTDSCSCKVNR